MKAKLAMVVLLVVAVVCGIGWFSQKKQASVRVASLQERVSTLSNDLAQASSDAGQSRQTAAQLDLRVKALTTELSQMSNRLQVAETSLSEAQEAAKAAARAAEEELNKRAARIAELEVANKNLDRQASAAKEALSDLESRIADLQHQLAAAQGDRDFLMGELKRLQTEKAEVERRFNDLVVLRSQVRKLQSELAATSQLEAIRLGLSGRRHLKGAELLRRGFRQRPATSTPVDLDVEIRRGGGSSIKAGSTNAPPSR